MPTAAGARGGCSAVTDAGSRQRANARPLASADGAWVLMAALPALKFDLEHEGRTLRMVSTRERPEWIEAPTPAAKHQDSGCGASSLLKKAGWHGACWLTGGVG